MGDIDDVSDDDSDQEKDPNRRSSNAKSTPLVSTAVVFLKRSQSLPRSEVRPLFLEAKFMQPFYFTKTLDPGHSITA